MALYSLSGTICASYSASAHPAFAKFHFRPSRLETPYCRSTHRTCLAVIEKRHCLCLFLWHGLGVSSGTPPEGGYGSPTDSDSRHNSHHKRPKARSGGRMVHTRGDGERNVREHGSFSQQGGKVVSVRKSTLNIGIWV
jgi:hypothetical protein